MCLTTFLDSPDTSLGFPVCDTVQHRQPVVQRHHTGMSPASSSGDAEGGQCTTEPSLGDGHSDCGQALHRASDAAEQDLQRKTVTSRN